MKKVFLFICLFAALHTFAQDSSKTKLKEYLGVLTLAEKFKEDKNRTAAGQANVGQYFQRLV